MGLHARLKDLWEIVSNENKDIEEVDFNADDRWREEIQMKVHMEHARRNRIKRRKEYRDDARKTMLTITKPQGGFCEINVE
jgi:serine phosphatase RsbU (regulator of sigma subunit)